MIDPFNVLLNKISYGLCEKDLQCLLLICEIPGGHAENIRDGLSLFKYLKRINRISREKVGYLRNLLRQILPKRSDLVHLVDEYIKKEYHTDDVRLVLDDFSQSLLPEALSPGPVVPPSDGNTHNVFNLNNEYMYCGCRKLPSCFWMLIILLGFAIIFTSLFWYADVPKISRKIKSNQDLKNGGVYVLIAECLLFVLLVLGLLWKKRMCHHGGYVQFNNPTVQANDGIEGKGMVSAPMACRNNYGGSSSDPEGIGAASHVSVAFIVSSGETVQPRNV